MSLQWTRHISLALLKGRPPPATRKVKKVAADWPGASFYLRRASRLQVSTPMAISPWDQPHSLAIFTANSRFRWA